MSGAPITIVCYGNAVLNHHEWVTDSAVVNRIKNLAQQGGRELVEDVLYFQREPWAKKLASSWPAMDSLTVELRLDEDRPPAR
ncbi:MAG: hypothetical protein U0269_19545 [Polyangiales bacterium]